MGSQSRVTWSYEESREGHHLAARLILFDWPEFKFSMSDRRHRANFGWFELSLGRLDLLLIRPWVFFLMPPYRGAICLGFLACWRLASSRARREPLDFHLRQCTGVGALDEAEEDLEEVLEVAELSQGGDVAGKGLGVVLVDPQRRRVAALPVGLAGAANASEVADELQGLKWVIFPGELQALCEGLLRRVGDDVEEEVKARVSGREEGRREILGKAPGWQGSRDRRLVEVCHHEVHERISRGGGGDGGGGRGRLLVDLRRADERNCGGGRSHRERKSEKERLGIFYGELQRMRRLSVGGAIHIINDVEKSFCYIPLDPPQSPTDLKLGGGGGGGGGGGAVMHNIRRCHLSQRLHHRPNGLCHREQGHRLRELQFILLLLQIARSFSNVTSLRTTSWGKFRRTSASSALPHLDLSANNFTGDIPPKSGT
ncbi:translation initiation factor IF-3 [Striga asiatica]|uniref:Translation initiation factor IF-3 n=1 Tax=Striga asiatica TaxID=4170 RepID=A0A5A7NZZ3_STRAF|nr:translation initiation factor IF-3 [Striga asiatica]